MQRGWCVYVLFISLVGGVECGGLPWGVPQSIKACSQRCVLKGGLRRADLIADTNTD